MSRGWWAVIILVGWPVLGEVMIFGLDLWLLRRGVYLRGGDDEADPPTPDTAFTDSTPWF